MARIIKILFIISLLSVSFAQMPKAAATGEQLNLSTLITSQNVTFDNCYKVFNIDNNSLFFLTISAINANRFHILETQSKSGYILFNAVNRPFVATVASVNNNQGMIRIIPADGNYYFQPGIILNIFKYIELNLDKKQQVIF